jgi:hypothetical protein
VKKSKWVIAIVVLSVLAMGAVGFLLGRINTSSANVSNEAPNWLFSLTADSGSLTKNADDTYTLTLNNADPDILAFTDRPDRDSAIIPLAKGVKSWPARFGDVPPNGVLVEHDPQGASNSIAVLLTNPSLSGTTLTFTATILDNAQQTQNAQGLVDRAFAEPPATFQLVSLFIDDVQPTSYSCMSLGRSTAFSSLITPPGSIPATSTQEQKQSFQTQCTNAGGGAYYM